MADALDRPWECRLDALIAAQAAATPTAMALEYAGETLTYSELWQWAQGVAARLRTLGIGRDIAVGIASERSFELVAGLVGILGSGGAYVPLGLDWPRDRIADVVADAGIQVVVTGPGSDNLSGLGTEVTLLPAAELRQAPQNVNPLGDSAPEDLAYIIFTPGTTGRPKGAMISHGAICNRLLWMAREYAVSSSDVVLQKTPYTFDVSVWELFLPLICGARLAIARPGGHRDTRYLVEAIRRHHVTTVHFVPSMLEPFLEEPGVESLASLRQVICSGEALSYDLTERFFRRLNVRLDNLYGPTEAAVDVSFWRCRPDLDDRVVPIGHAIDNIRLLVVDEDLQEVVRGTEGELCIAGVGLARGYVNRPDLTSAAFVEVTGRGVPGDRLYRTGDRARVRPDGAIEYLGRRDRQVKIRGVRIELGGVEAALSAHPDVRAAAAMLRSVDAGAPELVGYVVLRDEACGSGEAAVEALRCRVAECLPPAAVPTTIMVLDALPVTTHGKLDYRALPAPGQRVGTGRQSPLRDESERRVAEAFSRILGVIHVGGDDDFWLLGGDSLRALALRNMLDPELPITAVYELRSVAALASLIRDRGAKGWSGARSRSPSAHSISPQRSPRDGFRETMDALAATAENASTARWMNRLQRWLAPLRSGKPRPVHHRTKFGVAPPYALVLADDPRGLDSLHRAATLVLGARDLRVRNLDFVAELGGSPPGAPPGNGHVWGSQVTSCARRMRRALDQPRPGAAAIYLASRACPASYPDATRILVLVRGHAYELTVPETADVAGLAEALAAVRTDAESLPVPVPLGCLTAFPRMPEWGYWRARLMTDHTNRGVSRRLEETALALCLDLEVAPRSDTELAAHLATNAPNRWHEKGIQLVVSGTGRAGVIAHHAILDGAPAQEVAGALQRAAADLAGTDSGTPRTLEWKRIEWVLPPSVAAAAAQAATDPSPELSFVEILKIGDAFWRGHGLSPGAGVMVTLALAWTRALQGRVPLVIDTLDARHAAGGRVLFYHLMTGTLPALIRQLAVGDLSDQSWRGGLRDAVRQCERYRQEAVAGTRGVNWC